MPSYSKISFDICLFYYFRWFEWLFRGNWNRYNDDQLVNWKNDNRSPIKRHSNIDIWYCNLINSNCNKKKLKFFLNLLISCWWKQFPLEYLYIVQFKSNNYFYFNRKNQLNQLQLTFGVQGFTFWQALDKIPPKFRTTRESFATHFYISPGITPARDKNESFRIFPGMGMEGRDTRLINVQWRRRYTRISRLNTSGTVERRITRVPYAGVKFREIKNSEIYPLARYTRDPRGGRLLAWRTTVSFHPFPRFVWCAIWSSCGGWSYCAYLSRMEENSGRNRKFEVFSHHVGLFKNNSWNSAIYKLICRDKK